MNRRKLLAILVLALAVATGGCEIQVDAAYDAAAAGSGGNGSANGSGSDDGGSVGGMDDGGMGTSGEVGVDTGSQGDADGGSGGFDRWAGPWAEYNDQELIDRGEMLVENVAFCADCHTARRPPSEGGGLDRERFMAGWEDAFFDLDPMNDQIGNIPTGNITPSEAGIRDWEPEKLEQAFTEGWYYPESLSEEEKQDPKNRYIMAALMPYWVFNNMKERDRRSIIAFIRSIDPVEINISERQDLPPPWNNWDQRWEPVKPTPLESLPDTTLTQGDPNYQKAKEGKYWATIASCSDCHAPLFPPIPPEGWDPKPKSEGGDGPNFDYQAFHPNTAFRGGRPFPSVALGLDPANGWPPVIYTRNLTPGKNGAGQYSAQQIVEEMNTGRDVQGDPICPPMPAGPGSALEGMPTDIKEKIAYYVTTLPAKDPFIPPPLKKQGEDTLPNCKPPAD